MDSNLIHSRQTDGNRSADPSESTRNAWWRLGFSSYAWNRSKLNLCLCLLTGKDAVFYLSTNWIVRRRIKIQLHYLPYNSCAVTCNFLTPCCDNIVERMKASRQVPVVATLSHLWKDNPAEIHAWVNTCVREMSVHRYVKLINRSIALASQDRCESFGRRRRKELYHLHTSCIYICRSTYIITCLPLWKIPNRRGLQLIYPIRLNAKNGGSSDLVSLKSPPW